LPDNVCVIGPAELTTPATSVETAYRPRTLPRDIQPHRFGVDRCWHLRRSSPVVPDGPPRATSSPRSAV